eukprot:CAMPEP_0201524224 /NCGR_PEP_ID=MMETSP0161_2-20130828/21185_1 /ASSEMBLY_ACC=CAM_ASM_000251 /TAXON_ID=180227 /ORGANISM="Neoparamoeba aestuarina, Strain SoJaBio B1-5/56/2" /LENGTH=819 /DNA_ID=CAMNT_0047923521 /DNA_START=82 /DNA_END=2541 /DNA_ORIENTATION=-
MGELFRSQAMTLIQLVIPFDVAHETVDELGKIGEVQFKDMNPGMTAPQRAFVNDVKRIDEMERKLRYFHGQVVKFANKYDQRDILESIARGQAPLEVTESVEATPIPELENEFEDLERAMLELNQGEEGLKRMVAENFEKRYVLQIIRRFMEGSGQQAQAAAPLLGGGGGSSTLTTIIGSIPRERRAVFERVVWRVTRGNIFFKSEDIEDNVLDPNTDEYVEKSAFLILTQSDYASEKIRKLCESLGANTFDCPPTEEQQALEIDELMKKENDLNLILTQNAKGSEQLFVRIAGQYDAWRTRVLKEKSIYHTMNLFKYNLGGKALIAEGWCPSDKLEVVSMATHRATNRSGSALPVVFKPLLNTKETPPTYFRTNKFTTAHQEIVDAYGVARYQEINPTVFSIITFPFLFGVMFGDVGHGTIMLLFVLLFIIFEDKLMDGGLNEMVQTCFDGRYIIVLMAIFAIYNGFIYNECFSIPMNFRNTQYGPIGDNLKNPTMMSFNTSEDYTYRYLFGVDPAWKGAVNELYYYNSLKMKMSVLIGVTQMLLGITLSGFNAVYRKKVYDLIFEFVPQILFMLSIFGYLCFLIVYKWFTNYADMEKNPDTPPSLLNALVNMFLSPTFYTSNPTMTDDQPEMWGSQQMVQIVLLILALICVPWMLLPKPFLLKRDHNNKKNNYMKIGEPGSGSHMEEEEEEEEEFEFQEVLIHQIIHTIEYVLGAISNTASYLRLWALSLAHSELSTVFWEKVMTAGMTNGSVAFLFIAFAVWAALSFAVLMVMESLSAFLHALRLHWVEFQNKFYGGDGYKFIPFSYERILNEEES